MQSPSNYGNSVARRLLGGWEFLVITSRRTDGYLSLASGRDSIHGPNQFNIDLGLSRRIEFKEARALEIRPEFFNALNHPTFGNRA